MVIFVQTKINEKKKLYYSLSAVFGVGLYRSFKICSQLGYKPSSKIIFADLTNFQLKKIQTLFGENFTYGFVLRRQIHQNIKKYFSLNMYKGYRLQRGLPIRGQRTHTNANTIKRLKNLFINLK